MEAAVITTAVLRVTQLQYIKEKSKTNITINLFERVVVYLHNEKQDWKNILNNFITPSNLLLLSNNVARLIYSKGHVFTK